MRLQTQKAPDRCLMLSEIVLAPKPWIHVYFHAVVRFKSLLACLIRAANDRQQVFCGFPDPDL